MAAPPQPPPPLRTAATAEGAPPVQSRHRCTACREAHTACDRMQPCGRCVRIGRADECQQPQVLGKRGRPRGSSTTAPLPPPPAAPHHAVAGSATSPPAPASHAGHARAEVSVEREQQCDDTLRGSIERCLEDSLSESQGMGELLVMLMDELRDVRRSNSAIGEAVVGLKRKRDEIDYKLSVMHHAQRDQIKRLAEAQKRSMLHIESMIDQIGSSNRDDGGGMARLQDGFNTTTAASMMPFPPPLSPASPRPIDLGLGLGLAGEVSLRNGSGFPTSVMRTLPFLANYDFSKEPCVIQDLGQMMVVARINEPRCFDEVEPSTVFYTSPSLTTLLGYQMGELVGASTGDIYEGTFDVMVHILSRVLCVSTASVGPGLVHEGRHLCKTPGQSLNLQGRNQILYSSSGAAQWMLSVVDQVLPHDARLPPPTPYGRLLSDPYARRALRDAVEARLGFTSSSSPSPPS